MRKHTFETPSAPIPETEIVEFVDTDVFVAGAVPAGLAAAVSAAEKGAHVALLRNSTS
jgi:ribulose 1,5-bisphosphate synthetase/thiazole synthase